MRRICGILLAGGICLIASSSAKAQIMLGNIPVGLGNGGDPVGLGPFGVSNYKGYGVNGPWGQGYYTGLYWPTDTQGPSSYYMSSWSGLAGAPRDPYRRDWTFSPPWSKNYRQGQPKQPHKLSRLFHRHEQP